MRKEQEATVSLAAKTISLDAAVAAVLLKMAGMLKLKKEQRTTLESFIQSSVFSVCSQLLGESLEHRIGPLNCDRQKASKLCFGFF